MPFSRGSSDPGIESVSPTSPTPVGMLFTTSAIFSQASFTAAKMWKQPKCPLIDEWGKKMCTHTHTHTHTPTQWNITQPKKNPAIHDNKDES